MMNKLKIMVIQNYIEKAEGGKQLSIVKCQLSIVKYLLVVLLFLAIAGCRKEKEEDFSLPRDKYTGTWRCQTAEGTGYYTTISYDPSNSTQVLIQNYFALRGTVTAIVTEGTITVNNQKMQGISITHWCEGFGRLSKKNGIYTIFWELYADNDEETTSTYTKQ
jgi:hypothetical protein